MAEFNDLTKYTSKEIAKIYLELIKEKKAYIYIMVFDSSKITRKGIEARARNAFQEYTIHTWFIGDT